MALADVIEQWMFGALAFQLLAGGDGADKVVALVERRDQAVKRGSPLWMLRPFLQQLAVGGRGVVQATAGVERLGAVKHGLRGEGAVGKFFDLGAERLDRGVERFVGGIAGRGLAEVVAGEAERGEKLFVSAS